MPLNEGTTIYTLQRPVKYSRNGQTVDGTFIELREPQHSHFKEYCKLRQMVNSLQLAAAEVAQSQGMSPDDVIAGTEVKKFHETDETELGEESEQLAEMLMFAFGASDRVDMAEFMEIFGRMAGRGSQASIAAVDGVQPVTSNIWEKMHVDDKIQMAMTYTAFFCMPLNQTPRKESGEQSESAMQATAE